MISRRNYFSITIMMLVLLVLFQFSLVLKDRNNEYNNNPYAAERKADGNGAWESKKIDLTKEISQDRSYLLFVGEESGSMASAAAQWCGYVKWDFAQCTSIEAFPQNVQKLPEILILESESYAAGSALDGIKELQKQGVTVIFGCLEDAEGIAENQELKGFLGISSVESTETSLSGIKLFEGLLLGGEVIYERSEREDPQNPSMEVPWYRVGSGTKAYMVGLMDQSSEPVENEDLPTLIWRNGIAGGSVFAVVGDYMKGSTALGLLSGIAFESSEYTLYPIVNAQNLSILDFPGFAEENKEELLRRYSRAMLGMERDVMWPSLVSITEKNNWNMTCYLQPQADYLDAAEPNGENLTFYLKQMNEERAEAALSLRAVQLESWEDKAERDSDFFENAGSEYRFSAAFAAEEDLDDVKSIIDLPFLEQVSTVVCDYTETKPVVSYYTDEITLQMITNDSVSDSYLDDLRMRSIQTCLGYTNIMLNMQEIFWPEQEEDRWERIEKQFSRNLMNYWKPYQKFSNTTASQSDERTRTFLNLNYTKERTEDELLIETSLADSWFVLRTHGEEISEMTGGTWEELETGAYLIHAEETSLRIAMQTPGLHYSVSEQ